MPEEPVQEMWRQAKERLKLPPDAPNSAVLAALDMANLRACARLGLPASTPPKEIRAAEAAERARVSATKAAADAQRRTVAASMVGWQPEETPDRYPEFPVGYYPDLAALGRGGSRSPMMESLLAEEDAT